MKKVVATLPASMSETAAFTGNKSCIVHGWRPISATIHPDSEAIYAKGIMANAAKRNQV